MPLFLPPAADPESWNTLTIEGRRVPGKVWFPAFTANRKIDAKESPGSDVVTLADKGVTSTDVKVEFVLWEQDDFDEFQQIYNLYLDPRRPLKKRNVVRVVQPSLYQAGIKLVYFYAADGLQPQSSSEGRIYVCRSMAKEFTAKTRIGAGSAKPKPAPSYAGQGGKWTTTALGSAVTYGPPADAAPQPATPPTKTLGQQQAAAAKGDPKGRFVAAAAGKFSP